MEKKINKLKEKLQTYNTQDLLGMISIKFMTFANNGEEVAFQSDIFNKTNLMSPQKQYLYLAGLLMSTDNLSDGVAHDTKSDFRDIEKDIQDITSMYMSGFMDLDEEIVNTAGRSIPEIFATEGEAGFRQKELEVLKTIVGGWMSKTKSLPRLRRGPLPFTGPRAATVFDTPTTDNPDIQLQQISERGAAVLALGGGTVMTPECAELVKENTLCIYLRASIETLVEHLSSEAEERPLLARNTELRSRIENLLSQRTAIYENTAHIVVDTDNKAIEQIAYEISTLI